MLHTISWPAEAARPRAPARPPVRILRCEAAPVRWVVALTVLLAAAAARWLLDKFVDCGPFLTFLPAIAVTILVCGRWPAVAVIVLGGAACAYFWLPPVVLSPEWPTTLVSLALFGLIGLFELTLVDRLYLAARGSAERQRRLESALRLREIMVREMRHRIANQLQLVNGALEGSQVKIDGSVKVERVIQQTIGRIASITGLQRIVDDRAGYEKGLAPLLREILDHIFHDVDVAVRVRATSVALPDHHVTIVCLLVIEAAMNSTKHIFRRRRGCMFAVEVRAVADDRLLLTIWDYGPEFDAGSAAANSAGRGLSIMRDLAAELGGSLALEGRTATSVKAEFAGT